MRLVECLREFVMRLNTFIMGSVERLGQSVKPLIVLYLVVYDDIDLVALLFNILSCAKSRTDKQFGDPF
jgi:hypothetical protein